MSLPGTRDEYGDKFGDESTDGFGDKNGDKSEGSSKGFGDRAGDRSKGTGRDEAGDFKTKTIDACNFKTKTSGTGTEQGSRAR